MTRALSNGAVADLLERHGRLLEVAGESPFRTRAYSRAAEALRLHPEHIREIAAQGRLREIPGIRVGLAAVIVDILDTGRFAAHADLTPRIPE
jgi:DNA polymerase (family 10)